MEWKAPKGGYGFQSKAEYREQVWEQFAKAVPDVSTAKVAFLPSKEGLEIPVALKYGFKEENLVAIDKNKSMIAVSKWRKEYPKVKFYGSELARAGERIRNDKLELDAANLDLCGNVSAPTIYTVNRFLDAGILKEDCVISLTTMKGRECSEISGMLSLIADMAGGIKTNLLSRPCVVLSVASSGNFDIEILTEKEYKSPSNYHVQYSIFRLNSKRSTYEKELARNTNKISVVYDVLIPELNRLIKIHNSVCKRVSITYYKNQGVLDTLRNPYEEILYHLEDSCDNCLKYKAYIKSPSNDVNTSIQCSSLFCSDVHYHNTIDVNCPTYKKRMKTFHKMEKYDKLLYTKWDKEKESYGMFNTDDGVPYYIRYFDNDNRLLSYYIGGSAVSIKQGLRYVGFILYIQNRIKVLQKHIQEVNTETNVHELVQWVPNIKYRFANATISSGFNLKLYTIFKEYIDSIQVLNNTELIDVSTYTQYKGSRGGVCRLPRESFLLI